MQYFEILNLKREPFSNSPDPEFFYGSRVHAECLRKVEIAIRLRRGLNVVYGEVGTGKTTLCRQLLRVMARDQEIVAHLVLDPSFSTAREFLASLYRMLLGVEPSAESSEFALKEAIKNALFRLGVEEGKIVVLIVDEGQKAGAEFLELLRELLNYETNEAKLLQIVIFGQREFMPLLAARPNLEDRVNLSLELRPLNLDETREMISYRLRKAATTFKAPRIFNEGALRVVHKATGGYPRKIIGLCHRVLLAMLMQNRTHADRALVRVVLEGGGEAAPRTNRLALGVVVASLVLAGFLVGGAFMTPDTLPGRSYRYFSWWAKQGVEELVSTRPAPASPLVPGRAPTPTPAPAPALDPASAAAPSLAPAPVQTPATRPEAAATAPAAGPVVRVKLGSYPSPSPVQDPPLSVESLPSAAQKTSPRPVAPAATPAADAVELALPPGCPPALGRLRIMRGEILSDVISKVYGVYRMVRLDRVAAANPDLLDPDLVPAGSTVLLPSIPMYMPQAARQGYWLRLGSFSSLQQAWDFLDQAPAAGIKQRMVPWWSPGQGLRFDIVARGPFREESAAAALRADLPSDLAAQAQVVRLTGEDAVFFTDFANWKL